MDKLIFVDIFDMLLKDIMQDYIGEILPYRRKIVKDRNSLFEY
jgi:hypothetical protein